MCEFDDIVYGSGIDQDIYTHTTHTRTYIHTYVHTHASNTPAHEKKKIQITQN